MTSYVKYKPIDCADYRGSLYHRLERSEVSGRITWGEPAQICQCKLDKECPICERTRDNDIPIELLIEDNVVIAAYCHNCGWAF